MGKISKVLMDAVNQGKFIGYVGKGTGRPTYEAVVNGQKVKIGITIGRNGYIVVANYLGSMAILTHIHYQYPKN